MEDEINLKDIIAVIARWWKLIITITLLGTLCAFLYSLTMKPVYEAKSRILIRQPSQVQSSSSLAGPAAMAGLSFPSGSGSSGDMMELVDSRYVSELATVEAAEKSRIDTGRYKKAAVIKGKITGNYLELSIKHGNPSYAKCLNDAYVDMLQRYWNKLNYTEAKKKLDYISVEMPKKEAELRAAEDRLKSLMYLNGNQSTDSQSAATVDIERAKREVDILESVYTMLRKEYEQDRLEEAKEISPFSDVEPARLPVSPVSPKIGFNTAIGFVMGLFIGVFVAFIADNLSPQKNT
jgi:uncharacterized protein involved in exopolysaccharide biosynthesis